MSRTYRCRHLPVNSGRWMAKKIVDGRGYGFRQRREYAEAEAEKILGPKPEYKFHWSDRPKKRKTPYDVWYWSWVADQIAENWVAPVAGWHRHQRTPPVGGRKKYYRTQGNRFLRRRSKAILKNNYIDDDWTGHFPHKQEGFNWWDVY